MNLQALLTTVIAVNTCLKEKSLRFAPQMQPKLLSDPYFQENDLLFQDGDKTLCGFEEWITYLMNSNGKSIRILSANGFYQCGFLVQTKTKDEAWFSRSAQTETGYGTLFPDPFFESKDINQSWFIKKIDFQLQSERYSAEEFHELGKKLLVHTPLVRNSHLDKIVARVLPPENLYFTKTDRDIIKLILMVSSSDQYGSEIRDLANLAAHSLILPP